MNTKRIFYSFCSIFLSMLMLTCSAEALENLLLEANIDQPANGGTGMSYRWWVKPVGGGTWSTVCSQSSSCLLYNHAFNLNLTGGVNEKNYTVELRVQTNFGYDTETVTITLKRYRDRYQYIYITDHLGSIRITGHEEARVVGYDDYYPFGLVMPGRSSNTGNPNDNYKFTGYELDNEANLNLYHAGARMYDPVVPRFLQIDPLHMERPGLSPFNYVQNNPVTRVDPTGMLDDYYIREDGNIDVIRTDDETDTFYYVDNENQTTNLGTFEKNENGLIQLPGSHSINENGVSFGFSVKSGQGDKSFIAPEAFAAVLGAFAETGFSDFTITQFSNSDGSSPAPSISHVNGRNGDFRYLRTDGSGNAVTVFDNQFDGGRNAYFTNALSKYGYSDLKSYHIPTPYRNAVALPNTSHLKGHHNHLHLQGFRPKINTTFYPYIR